jgi:hypothetical protein
VFHIDWKIIPKGVLNLGVGHPGCFAYRVDGSAALEAIPKASGIITLG